MSPSFLGQEKKNTVLICTIAVSRIWPCNKNAFFFSPNWRTNSHSSLCWANIFMVQRVLLTPRLQAYSGIQGMWGWYEHDILYCNLCFRQLLMPVQLSVVFSQRKVVCSICTAPVPSRRPVKSMACWSRRHRSKQAFVETQISDVNIYLELFPCLRKKLISFLPNYYCCSV